jgi:hypothetical protein
MSSGVAPIVISENVIEKKILVIRGQQVMLDKDLAQMYGVAVKRLNEQVNRNAKRFPADFMFKLTGSEVANLKSQFATSSWGGTRKSPTVFTEHGILMLSSVLNSQRAIDVNIAIMRVFVRMKKMFITQKNILITQKEILRKLVDLERKTNVNTEDIQAVFKLVDRLLMPPVKPRRKIGFHH